MEADLFRELVFGDRIRVQSDFDATHQAAIEVVVADIQRSYSTLVMVTMNDANLFPGARYDSLSLLNEALRFLVSSLHLVRQGACVDALALLRVAVEAACVSVHVVLEANAYADYVGNSGKSYDSSRAISFAKSHIHRVGELWGALSQAAIHPNRRAFGLRIEPGGTASIGIGRQKPGPRQDVVTLTLISIAAAMVLQAVESALFEPDPGNRTVLQLVGTNMKMLATADRLLRKRFRNLEELSTADDR